MAKQVKVDNTKTKPERTDIISDQGRLTTRSPVTNLFFAGILGLVYLAVFNQSFQHSLVYAIGAFLLFNTIDYCFLYYRMNKRSK